MLCPLIYDAAGPNLQVYAKHRLRIPGFLASVHAGAAHSAAITDDGRVITWGAGSYGQLGTGFNNDCELPMLVEGLHSVTKLALGARHTLALCALSAEPAKTGKKGRGDDDFDDDDIYSDKPEKTAEELEDELRSVGLWAARGTGGGGNLREDGLEDNSLSSVLKDPLEGPVRFVVDEQGNPTRRRVV